MPTLRAKLFISLLSLSSTLRFKLKGKRPDTTVKGVLELRERTAKSSGLLGKIPKNVSIEPLDIDGLYSEWLTPRNSPSNKAILYFHGGGYVIGNAQAHRAIVAKFTKGSGIKALVFNYALAPEKPFPNGLNDAIKAYQYLLSNGFNHQDIIFMGDSAGGGLVLATLLALKKDAIELPAGAVTLSPWTDLTHKSESLKTNIDKDPLTWHDSWTDFAVHYCGKKDPSNPLISPIYGDLSGLPALQIYAGSDELLRDDSIRFAQKAKESGVSVDITIGDGMIHCYPACANMFTEATEAKNRICAFIQNKLR